MLVRLLVVGVLLAASSLATGEQIYKSVDASGNVTYSSTPPPGTAAQAVDLPPAPPPAEIEAARQRERSLQEMGDQMSQERQEREAQLAQERQAASAAAAAQQPVQPLQDGGGDTDTGWWIPGYPGYGPGVRPPFPPGRPVRPPSGGDPTQPPDDPVYWPREPAVPSGARPRPTPLPSIR